MTILRKPDPSQLKVYSYSRKKLFFSAGVAFSLFTGVGLFMGWASPALVLLKPKHYSSQQTSLLASLNGLAPGPLITMFGIDLVGRKYTLLTVWATLMLSWVLMLVSEEIHVLLAARFIGGWGMGAAFSAIGIYASEISDVKVRGALNSMSLIFVSLGRIIITSVGPFTTLRIISVVSLLVTSTFGIFVWFIPESPYYLVGKGRTEQARRTLLWLRAGARPEDVEEELKGIQFAIEEERKNKVGIKKLFTSKAVLRGFGIAWYILYLQQLSGMNPVSAYAQTIFLSAGGKDIAAYVPIALAFFGLVAGLPTPFLVKKFGNRIVFIGACIGCTTSHAILAAYFFLLESGHDISNIKWVPVFGTFLLEFTVYCGLGGIIWAVVSDLFAPSVKGYATGICGLISTFLGFVAIHTFGLSKDAYNFGPTFTGYSLVMLISALGLYFVPNLTAMSLQQIQDYFEGKASKKEEIA